MKRFTIDSKTRRAESSTLAWSSAKDVSYQPHNTTHSMIPATEPARAQQLMQCSGRIPRSPDIWPFQDEMCVFYTVQNLFKGPLSILYCNVLPVDPSDLSPHQSMMNHCLLAMAKVFYGVQNNDRKLVQGGVHLYGRGIRMLGQILSEVDCNVSTEMIASVYTLCIGEVCMTPCIGILRWY